MTIATVWTPQRPRIFFMHVPKTAGMTLRVFLGNQYPLSQQMPANSWLELLETDVGAFENYRLFQGHFTSGIFDLLPKDVRRIVFLREPIARTISHLRHLRRDPNFHPAHQLAAGRSLDELVRDDRIMDLCSNIQTAQLSNDIPGEIILNGLRSERDGGLVPNPDVYVLPPDLAQAEHTLERFHFVGFVESLPEDILQLSMALGLHPPMSLPKTNDDPGGGLDLGTLRPDTLAILRERNALDIALYERARRCPRITRSTVGAALIDHGAYASISQPTDFPMSGPIPGSNWHESEEEDGAAHRWTGPLNETMLDLPLAPGFHFEVSLRVMIENLDDLSVATGGIELPIEHGSSEDDTHRISFWVPSTAVQAGDLTSLCVRTRRVFKSSGTDVRLLSFLVMELSISRVEPDLPDQISGDDVGRDRNSDAQPASVIEIELLPPDEPAPDEPAPTEMPIASPGMVKFLGKSTGYFSDGWVRSHAVFRFQALNAITSMSLQIWAPPADEPLTVTLRVPGENETTVAAPRGLISVVQFPLHAAPATEFQVELVANREQLLSDTDPRYAAFVLKSIGFS
jgi:hypothetical protein